MARESSAEKNQCDDNCLHCKLPECILDIRDRRQKYPQRKKRPTTNLGVYLTCAEIPNCQLLPTKNGYEYFVFRPINIKEEE